MRVLYIAAVGTRAYRARHGDIAPELGGLRKAQMSLEALTRAGHEVLMLSSAVTGVNRIEWRREERELWDLTAGKGSKAGIPARSRYARSGAF